MEIRWCAECKDEKPFEVPPCADDHGTDCFDLACVECGHALIVGIHDDVVVAELVAA